MNSYLTIYNLIKTIKILTVSLLVLITIILLTITIHAQALTSTNYKIVDPAVDSGGGVSTSTNYNLLSGIDPTSDAKLTSTNYALKSGFPNGIYANVPLIRCIETTTTSGTTTCLNFPNAGGAQGECGTPGCYDRAKIEIDHQNNPIDTLYLVALLDNSTSTQYYLQSDHTISTTYDINDYMTICSIEGKDTRSGSGCASGVDPNWNLAFQSTNIYGLKPRTTYTVKVRALHGDFTESEYSPTTNVTTELPVLSFDIDIGTTSAANTNAPHSIALGTLISGTITTGTDLIWLDLNTNIIPGMTTYVKDLNNGLLKSITIPSESEDLATDPNANGGYGLKTSSFTQTSLGPLVASSTYDTGGAQIVGAVSTSNSAIFSTNTTGSNKGQITGGRAGISVKTRPSAAAHAGTYTDTLTFTMIANF